MLIFDKHKSVELRCQHWSHNKTEKNIWRGSKDRIQKEKVSSDEDAWHSHQKVDWEGGQSYPFHSHHKKGIIVNIMKTKLLMNKPMFPN